VYKGDLQQAMPVLERYLDFVQGAQLRLWIPRVAAPLGAAYAFTGRSAAALPLLEQAVEQASAIRLMVDQGLYRVWLSEAYLLAGRLDEAHAQAQHALEFSQDHKELPWKACALRLLGEVAAQRQPAQTIPAEAYYHQAIGLADALGMRPLQAHCHHGLGTLYTRAGSPEPARRELAAAIDLYRAMDMTFWQLRAETVLAQAISGGGPV
jgi:tetratricopeptide (TPR) repeat protein